MDWKEIFRVHDPNDNRLLIDGHYIDEELKNDHGIINEDEISSALGQVLKDSGAVLAQLMINVHGILLSFFMAYLLRIVTGTATVGMPTAGSLIAPIIREMASVNPYLVGLACCVGSVGITNVYSWFCIIDDW